MNYIWSMISYHLSILFYLSFPSRTWTPGSPRLPIISEESTRDWWYRQRNSAGIGLNILKFCIFIQEKREVSIVNFCSWQSLSSRIQCRREIELRRQRVRESVQTHNEGRLLLPVDALLHVGLGGCVYQVERLTRHHY